jgi:hypothetical protein
MLIFRVKKQSLTGNAINTPDNGKFFTLKLHKFPCNKKYVSQFLGLLKLNQQYTHSNSWIFLPQARFTFLQVK